MTMDSKQIVDQVNRTWHLLKAELGVLLEAHEQGDLGFVLQTAERIENELDFWATTIGAMHRKLEAELDQKDQEEE